MKLATLLVFSFLVVTLIGTFSSTYFLYLNSEKIIVGQVSLNLQSDSQLIEKSVETFLNEQKNKIELIATQSELSNEELLNMVTIDDSFYEAFVVNSSGIVAFSSDKSSIGLDKSKDAYFINARNQTYIKPAYFSSSTKKYSFAVSTPFQGSVLVIRTDLSYFDNILSDRTGLGETGESLMAFNNEKNETTYFTKRLFSDKAIVILPFAQAPLPMQNALNDIEKLTLGATDYRGVDVISVSNYIESLGVGMVTKIDYSEAMGVSRDQLIKLSFILLVLITFFVLVMSISISFWIVRPIRKITSDVESITKGDLSVQLEKSNLFEVQNLINSLNRILATMKLAILRTGLSKSDMGLGEMEKAKKEAEEKYKLMYETSLDARMILESPKWNFSAGNPAALKMFNIKDEAQLIRLTPNDLSPKTQSDGKLSSIKAKEMIEKAVKEGRAFFEWTHKRYNGENFSANVLLSRFEEGGKVYIQATVRDLSPEKKSDKKTLHLSDKIRGRK